MRVGVPKEIKSQEYRVGLTPGAVREYVAAGHQVLVETRAGDGINADDEVYGKAGAEIAATAEEIFAEAEMIVKVKEPQPVGVEAAVAGQDTLHLSASRARPQAGERADRIGLHGGRLRDGDRRARRAAAACADERGGGAARDRGGRPVAEAFQRRARHSDRRRARRAAGAGRRARRRRGRHACGADGGGARRGSLGHRQVAAAAARARRAVRGPRADALLHPRDDRGGGLCGRRGDRGGAGARRERPEARHAWHAEVDEARSGGGRCRDRSGRLLRDLACDDARRTRPTRWMG